MKKAKTIILPKTKKAKISKSKDESAKDEIAEKKQPEMQKESEEPTREQEQKEEELVKTDNDGDMPTLFKEKVEKQRKVFCMCKYYAHGYKCPYE